MVQSWWRNFVKVLPGYLFTVSAAVPVSAFGWILHTNGVSRQNALGISIITATSLGFILEAIIGKIWSKHEHPVDSTYRVQINVQYLSPPPVVPVFETAIDDDKKPASVIILLTPKISPHISEFHSTL